MDYHGTHQYLKWKDIAGNAIWQKILAEAILPPFISALSNEKKPEIIEHIYTEYVSKPILSSSMHKFFREINLMLRDSTRPGINRLGINTINDIPSEWRSILREYGIFSSVESKFYDIAFNLVGKLHNTQQASVIRILTHLFT